MIGNIMLILDRHISMYVTRTLQKMFKTTCNIHRLFSIGKRGNKISMNMPILGIKTYKGNRIIIKYEQK